MMLPDLVAGVNGFFFIGDEAKYSTGHKNKRQRTYEQMLEAATGREKMDGPAEERMQNRDGISFCRLQARHPHHPSRRLAWNHLKSTVHVAPEPSLGTTRRLERRMPGSPQGRLSAPGSYTFADTA